MQSPIALLLHLHKRRRILGLFLLCLACDQVLVLPSGLVQFASESDDQTTIDASLRDEPSKGVFDLLTYILPITDSN